MKKHKQWPKPRECIVKHPDYKDPLTVTARDEPEAIWLAAQLWDRKWTDYKFWAYCTVISEKPKR